MFGVHVTVGVVVPQIPAAIVVVTAPVVAANAQPVTSVVVVGAAPSPNPALLIAPVQLLAVIAAREPLLFRAYSANASLIGSAEAATFASLDRVT